MTLPYNYFLDMQKHRSDERCFFCILDSVFPASGFAFSEEQFQQMAGTPAFCAEGVEAAFAAAEDGTVLLQLGQSAAADGGALRGIGGAEHVDVAAATDDAGIGAVAAHQLPKLEEGIQLRPVTTDGTGGMPDESSGALRQILFPQIPHQRRPDGDDLHTGQLPHLDGAVGAGGVDAADTLLI